MAAVLRAILHVGQNAENKKTEVSAGGSMACADEAGRALLPEELGARDAWAGARGRQSPCEREPDVAAGKRRRYLPALVCSLALSLEEAAREQTGRLPSRRALLLAARGGDLDYADGSRVVPPSAGSARLGRSGH